MCDQHLKRRPRRNQVSGSEFRVPGSGRFATRVQFRMGTAPQVRQVEPSQAKSGRRGRAFSRAAVLEFGWAGSSVASPHLDSGFRVPSCHPSKSDQIRLNPGKSDSKSSVRFGRNDSVQPRMNANGRQYNQGSWQLSQQGRGSSYGDSPGRERNCCIRVYSRSFAVSAAEWFRLS